MTDSYSPLLTTIKDNQIIKFYSPSYRFAFPLINMFFLLNFITGTRGLSGIQINGWGGWLIIGLIIYLVASSLFMLFRPKLIVSQRGIQYFRGLKAKTFYQWQNFEFIDGFLKSNSVFVQGNQQITLHHSAHNGSAKGLEIRENDVDNFFNFIAIARHFIAEDRINFKPKNSLYQEVFITKFNRVVTLLNILMFSGYLICEFMMRMLHLSSTVMVQGYELMGDMLLAMLLLIGITLIMGFVTKSEKFVGVVDCILNLFVGLFMAFQCSLAVINVCDERYLDGQPSNFVTLKALTIQPDYQRWQFIIPNTTEKQQARLTFILNEDFLHNSNFVEEKLYQVPAYQGSFDMLVITPEQFRQAKPIK